MASYFKQQMKILVTAFSPFDGRSENASLLALRELKAVFPDLWTRILPVDMVMAPARLRQALRSLRPDALILLGEAAGSKTIRLETTAWNELNFRIPDNAGRSPAPRPIRPSGDGFLQSTLPFERILARLVNARLPAILSNNPGRYLCNQVLYVAIDYLKTTDHPCRAGFIHLPLAQDLPTEQAAIALSHVVHELRLPIIP
jgi:pyroglutamyl-peptidase